MINILCLLDQNELKINQIPDLSINLANITINYKGKSAFVVDHYKNY
jgi:multidrug efflux pump subunit AcrB